MYITLAHKFKIGSREPSVKEKLQNDILRVSNNTYKDFRSLMPSLSSTRCGSFFAK